MIKYFILMSFIFLSLQAREPDIFQAIKENNLEQVKKLIPSIDKNVKDEDGRSLLHSALFYMEHFPQRMEVIKIFKEHGINLNEKDELGQTATQKASWMGHLELLTYLIENGADPNLRDRSGWSPLHEASRRGYYDIAVFLIENGADLHARNKDNWNALHFAARNGNSSILKLLIQNGLNVDLKDHLGQTALHLAFVEADFTSIKILIELSSDLYSKNIKGEGIFDLLKKNTFLSEEKKQEIKDYLSKKAEKQTKPNLRLFLRGKWNRFKNKLRG